MYNENNLALWTQWDEVPDSRNLTFEGSKIGPQSYAW
jgi:hypothetical protein